MANIQGPATGDLSKAQPITIPVLLRAAVSRDGSWDAIWVRYKATQPAIIKRRLPWLVVVLMGSWVFSQHFAVAWVYTRSVGANCVLVIKGAPPARGDLVAFRYEGQEIGGHRKGEGVLKFVAGLPGETVRKVGRDFFIGDQFVGHAKERSGVADPGQLAKLAQRFGIMKPAGPSIPLQASEGGVIPSGYVYLMGTDKDALDSRYAAMGLVPISTFMGRAVKLF